MLTAISEENKRSNPDLSSHVDAQVDTSFNSLVDSIEKENTESKKDTGDVGDAGDSGMVETIIEAVADSNTENIIAAVEHLVETDIFEDALNTLNKKIGKRVLTPQYLMIVVKYAMEIVEAIDMKGSEQREFVIDLLKRVVIDAPLSHEHEQICIDMINSGAVGQTIDLIIDATHGRINVNHVEDLAVNCCYSFLGFGKRKRKRKH